MNIFILDSNPVRAAQYLGDGHFKMVLESGQIGSTVLHRYDVRAPYKPTHRHRACVLWAGNTSGNWSWFCEYALALCVEYERRFGREHGSAKVIRTCAHACVPVPIGKRTPFVADFAGADTSSNAVHAYRRYYAARQGRPTDRDLGAFVDSAMVAGVRGEVSGGGNMKDSWEEVANCRRRASAYLVLRDTERANRCLKQARAMTDRLLSRHAEPAVAVPGHIPDYTFTLDSKRITYDGASLAQAISRAMS